MKTLLASLFLLALTCACKATGPDYGKPLPPGAPALLPLAPGEAHPNFGAQWNARAELLPALDVKTAAANGRRVNKTITKLLRWSNNRKPSRTQNV